MHGACRACIDRGRRAQVMDFLRFPRCPRPELRGLRGLANLHALTLLRKPRSGPCDSPVQLGNFTGVRGNALPNLLAHLCRNAPLRPTILALHDEFGAALRQEGLYSAVRSAVGLSCFNN